jgi:hypothetical protein
LGEILPPRLGKFFEIFMLFKVINCNSLTQ